MAVVSTHFGLWTGAFMMSDWNCMRKLFLQAPPSTFKEVRWMSESFSMALRTSFVWNARDSSVALMMWYLFTPRVRPVMTPLAKGSQYGAPRPVNAGTT